MISQNRVENKEMGGVLTLALSCGEGWGLCLFFLLLVLWMNDATWNKSTKSLWTATALCRETKQCRFFWLCFALCMAMGFFFDFYLVGFVNIFIGELGVGWGVPRFCSLLYRPCQCSQQHSQCLYVAVTFHVFSPAAEDSLLRKGSLGHTFILNHNQGTAPVQYNAAGWLRLCRDSPISKNSTMILQDSKRSVDLAACLLLLGNSWWKTTMRREPPLFLDQVFWNYSPSCFHDMNPISWSTPLSRPGFTARIGGVKVRSCVLSWAVDWHSLLYSSVWTTVVTILLIIQTCPF